MHLYYKSGCAECQKVLDYLSDLGKTLPMTDVRGHPREAPKQTPSLVVDEHESYTGSKEINLWLQSHKNSLSDLPNRL